MKTGSLHYKQSRPFNRKLNMLPEKLCPYLVELEELGKRNAGLLS